MLEKRQNWCVVEYEEIIFFNSVVIVIEPQWTIQHIKLYIVREYNFPTSTCIIKEKNTKQAIIEINYEINKY